jgi:ABC-type bacteriocin/lantibiotic exporter with double-glycine peptidase domain
VRFEGVDFAYRPGAPILGAVGFDVAPGERLALVGGSGAGKSTVAALLIRLIEPTGGRILLDDMDLSGLALADVRRSVCLVEHQPFIYSGTVRDNLRYGTPAASPQAVAAAIAITELTEVIGALPQGMETVLEEEGHNLSAGQRQRVALARAIVREPAILILDEATSGLDGDTEARIFASLERWLGARTLIVMSHRLSTVARFSRIVVLADGRVAGDGSLTHLAATCEPFSTLFADQMAALQ